VNLKRKYIYLKEIIISWEIEHKPKEEQEEIYNNISKYFDSVWLDFLNKLKEMDGIKTDCITSMYSNWFYTIFESIDNRIANCLRWMDNEVILTIEPKDWK
jgi:hypothetical protein